MNNDNKKALKQALTEEALDKALAELIHQSEIARDCFIMGEEAPGREAFNLALSAICEAVHQISLLNRK